MASKRLAEHEQRLIGLEKAINPLLDDDDMVGFSYILSGIVQECKNLPKSAAFHTKVYFEAALKLFNKLTPDYSHIVKVDAKKVVAYYDRVERPMDLGSIEANVKEHRYTTVAAFLRDIEQVMATFIECSILKQQFFVFVDLHQQSNIQRAAQCLYY